MLRPLSATVLLGTVLLAAACSSDESSAPHGHTPHTVKVFDGASELTEPVQLTAGQTVRVEVKFYDDEGGELVGLDADHVADVAFTPAGLASVAAVAGEPFQFDVTAQGTPGSGTFTVGWGHDDPTDLVFGPFDVDVVAPAPAAVTIQFAARVGATPFACGQVYGGVGSPAVSIAPKDFRMYVHDVRLVHAGGEEPLALDQDGTWQHQNLALLDFEDATGACSNGTAPTHTVVTGQAPAYQYTGIKFKLGVPFTLNHADVSLAPSPLNLAALFWSWQGGYKFLRLDATVDPAGTPVAHNIHLGSTGCTSSGPTDAPTTACTQPNVVDVALTMDPVTQVVVADVAALVAGSNMAVDGGGAPGCMSGTTDPECGPLFARLGLPFGSTPAIPQSFLTAVTP